VKDSINGVLFKILPIDVHKLNETEYIGYMTVDNKGVYNMVHKFNNRKLDHFVSNENC
jgi:hypothetical protein